jgi:hypothetical protein
VIGEPRVARCSKKLAVSIALIFSTIATKKLVHGGVIVRSNPLGGFFERLGKK